MAGRLLTLGTVAGVAAGVFAPVPVRLGLAVAVASAAVAVAVPAGARRACALAAIVAAAAAHGAAARERALAPPLVAWFAAAGFEDRSEEPVRVAGTLARDAAADETGVRLLIDVRRVRRDGHGWTEAGGRVQVLVAGDRAPHAVAGWTAGRRVEAPVQLRRPAVWQNPGAAPPARQALRRPFALTGSIKSALLVDVRPAPWPAEAAAAVRRHVREAARRWVARHDPQSAAVVTAILIGDRTGLAPDLERRLQWAGIYHVIAISGGNVALFTAIAVVVLRRTCRSHRIVSIAAIAVVLAYGSIVSDEPSVRRAVAAACVFLGLGAAGLASSALAVLCLVAAGLAVADPRVVADVGAWLSFGATAAILVGVPRLVPAASASAAPAATAARRAAAALFAATLSAELALAPVAAGVFSRVTVAGLALNFVAIPAMAAVQVSGVVLAAADAAGGGPVAAAAGWAVHAAASVLIGSGAVIDAAPWLTWRVPPPPAFWIAGYYGGLAALVAARRRGPRRGAIAVAATCLAAIVTAPGLSRAAPPPGSLRVTFLDVGQGDAAIVQFPSGHVLLVDAGGVPGAFDVGSRVITPAAWALGARRVDWLAITHPDQDHVGGAPGVVRDLRPREVWEGIPVPGLAAREALRADAARRGAVWRQMTSGHAIEAGAARLDVVHPPSPDWERRRARNDDSLVLRVAYGRVEFWLTGDAGPEFERGLAAERPAGTLRVLKVAHHGSRSATSAAFVERLAPDVAVISAGRGNLFGHPAAEVLDRLARVRARVFRTDRDGAVVLETDGRRLRIETAAGRRWAVAAAGR